MFAFLYRTTGSASAKTSQQNTFTASVTMNTLEWVAAVGITSSSTHRFPVVKRLIAVGDVAEQRCAETRGEQALKGRGAFRSPNLTSSTDRPGTQKQVLLSEL